MWISVANVKRANFLRLFLWIICWQKETLGLPLGETQGNEINMKLTCVLN